MVLTNAQLSALAADIAASEFSALPQTPDNAFAIAEAYNLGAEPVFVVWRTDVSVKDAKNAMVWTEYVGRSHSERDAWRFMLANGILDASDVNVRQGIQDIFSGPQGAGTRSNLTAIAKRNASRVEALFATGTGSGGSPGTLVFEGTIGYRDVLRAWAQGVANG